MKLKALVGASMTSCEKYTTVIMANNWHNNVNQPDQFFVREAHKKWSGYLRRYAKKTTMNKFTLICVLVLVLDVANASSLESCISPEVLSKFEDAEYSNLVTKENNTILNAGRSEANEYVMVSIFNSYFPIPTSFALSGSGTLNGNTLRLFRHGNEFIKKPNRNSLVGSISIGSHTKLKQSLEADAKKGLISKTNVFHKCNYKDYSIEFMSNEDFPKQLVVYVSKGDEYLMFTGDNPYLWKSLIRLHGVLNN